MARNIFIFAIIAIAALLRISGILPENVNPVAAIALFGGALFANKIHGLIIPLAIMFLSDLYIGLHDLMIPVYLGFIIIGMIGFAIRKNPSIGRALVGAGIGSILFFIITNGAVWMSSGFYTQNIGGLIDCYVSGLPFFRNTLIGDMIFTSVLFGSYHAATYRFPRLAKIKA
ncbi:MAG: hypothetical protein ACI9YU_001968 [Flavobacteriales bacterium]|jgi:hypothetical protein